MLQIGVTGGIGSGKSVVCRIFGVLGIPVYDADTAARRLLETDAVLQQQIVQHFGPEAYSEGGKLNRPWLAAQVFNDSTKTALLNGLVHPRVGEDYAAWATQRNEAPYLLKEAALLYESGSWQSLDKIIVVTAPEALRLQRVRHRDPHRTDQDIAAIMARQLPEVEKQNRADYLVHNDETQLVLPQVLALDATFRAGLKNPLQSQSQSR